MAVLDGVTMGRVRERVVGRGRQHGPLSWLIDLDVVVPAYEELVREVRAEAADEVWAWWREHRDREVLTLRTLRVIPVATVRLGQLRRVIEWICGPEPEAD